VIDSDETVVEEEVSETFTLIAAPTRITLAELPTSPKGAFKLATAMGWDVSAWITLGEFAPTLYTGSTDTHVAGEVKAVGYHARIFTVEARDPLMPLGFQAHYLGKQYADGRKASGGSFEHARVADPVGVATGLNAKYAPIGQVRGQYENNESIERRKNDAQADADRMNLDYNTGAIGFAPLHLFRTAGDFKSWLAEWQSFMAPAPTRKLQKEATNV